MTDAQAKKKVIRRLRRTSEGFVRRFYPNAYIDIEPFSCVNYQYTIYGNKSDMAILAQQLDEEFAWDNAADYVKVTIKRFRKTLTLYYYRAFRARMRLP